VELRGYVPRQVVWSRSGKFLIGCIAVMILAAVDGGVWLSAKAYWDQERRMRIERDAVEAKAEVIRVGTTGSDEGPRRFAVYRYAAGSRLYEDRVRLRRRDRRPLEVGSELSIRYLPDAPAESWVRGYEPGVFPSWVAVALAALLGGSALSLIPVLIRQRRLLQDGRVAEARVIGSKKKTGDHGTYYEVEYQYRILSGAVRTVKRQESKAPGQSVTVLYDRERPGRMRVFPLSLVRVRRQSG
jgi:hypothetical protein